MNRGVQLVGLRDACAGPPPPVVGAFTIPVRYRRTRMVDDGQLLQLKAPTPLVPFCGVAGGLRRARAPLRR